MLMKIVSIAEKYAIFVSGLCNYAPIGRIKVVLHCFTAVCFSVCLSVDMSVSFSQQWVRILKCNLVYRFILRISESSPTFGYDRAIIDRVDMTLDLKKIPIMHCIEEIFVPFIFALSLSLSANKFKTARTKISYIISLKYNCVWTN